MDGRVKKLKMLGVADAESLVAAGLDTPRKIKHATDDALLAVRGVGPAKLQTLRDRFAKVK